MSAAVSVPRNCINKCINANLTLAAHDGPFRAILFLTVRTIRTELFQRMGKSSWIGRGNPSNEQSRHGHSTVLPVNLQPSRWTKHQTKIMHIKRIMKNQLNDNAKNWLPSPVRKTKWMTSSTRIPRAAHMTGRSYIHALEQQLRRVVWSPYKPPGVRGWLSTNTKRDIFGHCRAEQTDRVYTGSRKCVNPNTEKFSTFLSN
jgi:hypothetical protein